MKKSLLLALMVLLISGLTYSQISRKYTTALKVSHKLNHGLNYIDKVNPSSYVGAQHVISHEKKAMSLDDVHKYYIGSSANLYTALVQTSTCLTANQDLNTIMFTYRANPLKLLNAISGNILSSYSTDGGVNWKMINITGSDDNQNRYPSGVIYNPPNNTDPLKSYAVICGPTTDGSSWTENYFGSARLDSTNFNVQYVPFMTYSESFPRIGLASCDDGNVHVMGYSYYDSNLDSIIFRKGIINNGSFDTLNKKFTWTNAEIDQSFYNVHDTSYFSTFNTCWSQDGMTGYVYFIGIDSIDNYESYMPIVYKSVDGGKTWDKLPDYDFSQLTELTSKLWRTELHDTINEHKTYPYFTSENDGVVDANGNLHIFGIIQGRFSDNIDSIDYIYLYEPHKLFDVYTTSSGDWGAQLIDTIESGYVPASEGIGTGTSATGWDHRIQTSRTKDGKKIFAVWTDTDTLFYGVSDDLFPDIIAYGEDVTTGLKTICKNFTKSTDYQGDNIWDYVGDLTMEDGTTYRIPITTTSATNNDPNDSVSHYYLTGIYFTESDFVTNPGVKEVSANNFTVSQNYPNPYKYITSVNVNLQKPSSLSLEVRNLLGQIVYEIPERYTGAGEHTLRINSNNLKPGIYFYTVRVGQNSVSRKMIVR